ncbi:hypothetical protein [Ornithinibacillus scapharcae]|uniref:hypothetical protein n=1 Tax=Ornithinibacillus scapharcae TaxID=1147159 RepID=UPI000225B054|nr:hypothetical protein [Ornithinibacillus scapharcae]
MGFKQWFKEGMKDAMKPQVELVILAGSEQLNAMFPGGFKKTQMYDEGDGFVKIFVPGAKNIIAKLIDIEWEESAKRSAGKAAVGAIGGTLVAGPLAGVAGAAIGGRRKDNSKAFIYLMDDKEKEYVLHIECDKSTYTKIASMRRAG